MTILTAETLTLIAGLSAAAAGALVVPRPVRFPRMGGALSTGGEPRWWLTRYRWLWSLLAAGGVLVVVPGALALPAAGAGASWISWVIGRAEPPVVRRERERAQRELVPLIALIAAALGAGAPPGHAVGVACDALPGAASRRLDVVRAQLALGSDSGVAWRAIAADEVLGPLGRAIIRADRTGAPVSVTVTRLADELAAKARAEAEDRARVVGVKAAVPLGVCLLPSFLLIGIVPMAAGLLESLT